MDPLSALSLADTVVRFVDFGIELFFDGRKLYKSAKGTLSANDELELTTKRLADVCLKLRRSFKSTSSDVQGCRTAEEHRSDESLNALCDGVAQVTQELISKLNKLKLKSKNGKPRVWDTIRQAINNAFSVDEKFSLVKRLSRFKAALETRHNEPVEIYLALSQFVNRLEALETANQKEHVKTQNLILSGQTSVGAQPRPEYVRSGIEMLDVSPTEEIELHRRVANSILKSLPYPSMISRYENVVEAHATTFEWAFKDQTDEHFHGAIWENGSKPDRVSIGGTLTQRSQAGMLRSLLHQILENSPDLIPMVIPHLWAKTYSRLLSRKADDPYEPWSLKQLLAAFKAIFEQEDTDFKICFFIDGLDKFDGKHEGLATLFKAVTSARPSKVKACLSSRPRVVFEDMFQRSPRLKLQDLTYSDIKIFVEDKFATTQEFARLRTMDPQAASELVKANVDKAEGNRDEISHLRRRRLDALPRELNSLCDHMFDKIDFVYLEWASRAFQIFRAYVEIGNKSSADSLRGPH
ncbi:uncharacterized protein PAC_13194 [Phialocephala subalpina]|uniref:Nephrocystin 3-like N-terminal domain-containing protein n=1 Tax=Phialocephala subalpina TaxID=576137 RepID=A0A1L7XEB4_9HELO|nr:uncharacterized protein PAC_13194 [Phialocephala subalpina]